MTEPTTPQADPWRSDTVTRSVLAWPPEPVEVDAPAAPPRDPRQSNRRMLMWFGGAATGIVVVGLVVLLVTLLTGEGNPLRRQYGPPSDDRPPLARLCPPPTAEPAPRLSVPVPVPSGPRTVDPDSGISYRKYPDPWLVWHDRWSQGTLQVSYAIGQHFVTETYTGGTYHASILSGKVPATVNDALAIDLACTGRQVAADVRSSYYPQPNRVEPMRDEQAVLGGLPAWVTVFRLHFTRAGLQATSELVGVALIDIGQTEAAVLYVSIPNTHGQFDWVVEDVLNSVRPA